MNIPDPAILMRDLTAQVEHALQDGLPAESASLTTLAMAARLLHATLGPTRAAEHLRDMAEIVLAEQEMRH